MPPQYPGPAQFTQYGPAPASMAVQQFEAANRAAWHNIMMARQLEAQQQTSAAALLCSSSQYPPFSAPAYSHTQEQVEPHNALHAMMTVRSGLPGAMLAPVSAQYTPVNMAPFAMPHAPHGTPSWWPPRGPMGPFTPPMAIGTAHPLAGMGFNPFAAAHSSAIIASGLPATAGYEVARTMGPTSFNIPAPTHPNTAAVAPSAGDVPASNSSHSSIPPVDEASSSEPRWYNA